jgi:hydroxycarboxylate dehydrogenase B
VLVDPQRLGTATTFGQEAIAFVEWLKKSPPAPGSEGALLAGEPERAARKQREREGIAIDDTTWAEILGAEQKALSLRT